MADSVEIETGGGGVISGDVGTGGGGFIGRDKITMTGDINARVTLLEAKLEIMSGLYEQRFRLLEANKVAPGPALSEQWLRFLYIFGGIMVFWFVVWLTLLTVRGTFGN